MRHLELGEALATLLRGRPIEQLLESRTEHGRRIFRFLRLDRERPDKFRVAFLEVIDNGMPKVQDMRELTPLDPEQPDGMFAAFDSPVRAVEFSCRELRATPRRFVLAGMIQDECRTARFSIGNS